MTKRQIKIAAAAFAALVILVSIVLHGDAAAAGVVSAFALLGTILCGAAGVCPI